MDVVIEKWLSVLERSYLGKLVPKEQLLWQDQHGLPQNGVLAILRTRDGYLWLGTIEGAARFDGVRFVVFDSHNTPEIKSSQILSLAEDRAGDLWLGAVGGGLTRYRDGRFRLYTTRDGLSSDFVRCLLADRAGKLWVGTRGEKVKAYGWGQTQFEDGGISYLDGSSWKSVQQAIPFQVAVPPKDWPKMSMA